MPRTGPDITPADTPFAQALNAFCEPLDRQAAAAALDCDESTLRNWITGRTVPPAPKRRRLAKALRIPVSAITR